MMAWNANVIIDNLQVMDLNYMPIEASFKNVDAAREINLDAEDFCAANGHLNGFLTRTVEPKCYAEGTDSIACAVCGAVKSTSAVAKLPHKFDSYNISRRTADGLVYISCNNDGCTEKRYTTLPDSSTYSGTLYEYYDMSDDMAILVGDKADSKDPTIVGDGDNGWKTNAWSQANGVLSNNTATNNNYNYFEITSRRAMANNWTWNLDLIYRGNYANKDSDGDGTDKNPGYGNIFYVWCGGSNTIGLRLGYDATQHKLFIVDGNAGQDRKNPFPNGTFKSKTADFTMVEGEEYNFAVTMTYNKDGYPDDESKADQWDACVRLYVNGELKLEFSEATNPSEAFFQIPYADDVTTLDTPILRIFGVKLDIDTMAIGTADFAYTTRVYNGDVDGDYAITAADALLMRKYLARVIDLSALVSSRADANGDGVINAKDQLVIRKAIAA